MIQIWPTDDDFSPSSLDEEDKEHLWLVIGQMSQDEPDGDI